MWAHGVRQSTAHSDSTLLIGKSTAAFSLSFGPQVAGGNHSKMKLPMLRHRSEVRSPNQDALSCDDLRSPRPVRNDGWRRFNWAFEASYELISGFEFSELRKRSWWPSSCVIYRAGKFSEFLRTFKTLRSLFNQLSSRFWFDKCADPQQVAFGNFVQFVLFDNRVCLQWLSLSWWQFRLFRDSSSMIESFWIPLSIQTIWVQYGSGFHKSKHHLSIRVLSHLHTIRAYCLESNGTRSNGRLSIGEIRLDFIWSSANLVDQYVGR